MNAKLICPHCGSEVFLGYKHNPERWKCYQGGHVGWKRQLV